MLFRLSIKIGVTLNVKNSRITISYQNFSIFKDISIIQAYRNTVKWLISSPYNIDNIFAKIKVKYY